MNKIMAVYLFLAFPFFINAQALIHFPSAIIDLDTLTEGEIRKIVFPFQNIGNDTLRLSSVHSTCGCTVPAWKAKDIYQGYWDTIFATYNSVGHLGNIGKSIFVEYNGGKIELKINGKVMPFRPDVRLYYGSGGDLIQYEVVNPNHILFKNNKDTSGKYSGDISLVVSTSSEVPKILSIDKAEMEAKGISIKVLRQQNMNISYSEPYDNKLENRMSFIYRFSFAKTENTSLNIVLGGEKIKIDFIFQK